MPQSHSVSDLRTETRRVGPQALGLACLGYVLGPSPFFSPDFQGRGRHFTACAGSVFSGPKFADFSGAFPPAIFHPWFFPIDQSPA